MLLSLGGSLGSVQPLSHRSLLYPSGVDYFPNGAQHGQNSTKTMAIVQHNPSPWLHPFEREREYQRACSAAKLERLHAQPFVAAYEHSDAIRTMAIATENLIDMAAGSADGQLRAWNLQRTGRPEWAVQAHDGACNGIASMHKESWVSAGADAIVKMWKKQPFEDAEAQKENAMISERREQPLAITTKITPVTTWSSNTPINAIDAQEEEEIFATAGGNVRIWSTQRNQPVHTYEWGSDTINTVRFNRVEKDVLAATSTDRAIMMVDTRTKTPIRKIIMAMQANAIAWNPREPFMFAVASEDTNAYTFDMRKLEHASVVHEDHINAVMAVEYAPTGRELVTGSYDKTVRIFRNNEGHSREVYHTRRMQRIFCVKFTADNKFVLSGSEDANVRLWKARSSERLGVVSFRERQATNYRQKLLEKFAAAPEIKRISRHRNLPKYLHKTRLAKHERRVREAGKDKRVRAHTKPSNQMPFENRKTKQIIKEVE